MSVTPEVSHLVHAQRNKEMLKYDVTLNKILNNWWDPEISFLVALAA